MMKDNRIEFTMHYKVIVEVAEEHGQEKCKCIVARFSSILDAEEYRDMYIKKHKGEYMVIEKEEGKK